MRKPKEELRVFIGWDDREKTAYEVCKFSLEKHTKANVKIIPLYHKELRKQGYFQRPWLTHADDGNRSDLIDGRPFSTEFSHTRFLVPELMGFKGWALFLDCDMLFRGDVKELFEMADDRYAVMCVKHRHKVKSGVKMDGSLQQDYFRKNWSSFMMINCGHPSNRKLTKEVVNTARGGWMHALSWLEEHEIGNLPDTYNWIAGVSPSNVIPKVIHYSEGGPWMDGYQECVHADLWYEYFKSFSDDLPMPALDLNTIKYGELK
jgi:lipopolysaccharide biosynthesis glycosyltransferase